MNKEDQPSGLNPEWETDKEQNIAIAKRIDEFLLEGPDALSLFKRGNKFLIEEAEEMQNVEVIRFLEEHGIIKEDIPEQTKEELVIEELTLGSAIPLIHIDNKYRRIFLGVVYSEEALQQEEIGGFIGDLLPKGFNLPVYIITLETMDIDDNSPEFYTSTIYGKMPNKVIGANGIPYSSRNVFVVNVYGQGLKTEKIIEDRWFNESERREEEHKLTRVDFVPREEHSRVVPLGPEEYAKINKMFQDIDAGLYQYPAL